MKKINQFINIYSFINDKHFKNHDKSWTWMFTYNPLLGDMSPYDLIVLGRFEKLRIFVLNQIDESKEI